MAGEKFCFTFENFILFLLLLIFLQREGTEPPIFLCMYLFPTWLQKVVKEETVR